MTFSGVNPSNSSSSELVSRGNRKIKHVSNVDPHDVEHWPVENDKRGHCKQSEERC
jgi:hypothetical protein